MAPNRGFGLILNPVLTRAPHSSSLIPSVSYQSGINWRNFSVSRESRASNFDTLKVVQRLQAQGFTPEQSKEVLELLKDVIDESILGLTRTMVTREEQDKVSSTPSPCAALY